MKCKILSLHIKQLIQHNSSSNHIILYFDYISKTIVDLGTNKVVSNDESDLKQTDTNNSLLTIIVDTP